MVPFGLMNARVFFQRLMDYILKGLAFVRVYLDVIMIFTETIEKHVNHVQQGMDKIAKKLPQDLSEETPFTSDTSAAPWTHKIRGGSQIRSRENSGDSEDSGLLISQKHTQFYCDGWLLPAINLCVLEDLGTVAGIHFEGEDITVVRGKE